MHQARTRPFLQWSTAKQIGTNGKEQVSTKQVVSSGNEAQKQKGQISLKGE